MHHSVMIVYHEVHSKQAHLAQWLGVETGSLKLCLPPCGLFLEVQIVLEYFVFVCSFPFFKYLAF